jgi:hypothetical protein
MPYTAEQVTAFPETEASIDANADPSGGPMYIGTSESVGCGHEDSMNRLPDPNASWVNEESGEGLSDTPAGTGVGF